MREQVAGQQRRRGLVEPQPAFPVVRDVWVAMKRCRSPPTSCGRLVRCRRHRRPVVHMVSARMQASGPWMSWACGPASNSQFVARTRRPRCGRTRSSAAVMGCTLAIAAETAEKLARSAVGQKRLVARQSKRLNVNPCSVMPGIQVENRRMPRDLGDLVCSAVSIARLLGLLLGRRAAPRSVCHDPRR